MIVKIQPSSISGNVYAPASKSSMQRACAAALIKEGDTVISNPGKSNDDLAAIDVIQKLGAVVKPLENKLLISSKGVIPVSNEINCGESGLGLRMFAPIAALSSHEIILNGSGSLLLRPMNFFDEIFPLLKIKIASNNGKLPIKIKGPLHPADITIDGSLSSQFLTGLIMGYAASLQSDSYRIPGVEGEKKPVTIRVNNLSSKPYIDLTLQIMGDFGWYVENKNYKEFHFLPTTNPQPQTINYTVEGDWSGAAFLLVAGAIAGKITIEGLDINSLQADKAILSALKDAGAEIYFDKSKLTIAPSPLRAFYFNATDCPDLFPPLVALAAYCNGTTTIKGVTRLTHKESNRSASLQQEFKKMGIDIAINEDEMSIGGNRKLKGAVVHSHHDHRIAMSCAVAALKASGETTIQDAEAVNKSYSGFYDDLQKLNAYLQKT